MTRDMTRDQLRDLLASSLTVPLLTAFDAIGISETAGRKAYARGALPFRVIGVSGRLRVPSVDLDALLLRPSNSDAGAPTAPAVALTDEPSGGPRDDHGTTVRHLKHA